MKQRLWRRFGGQYNGKGAGGWVLEQPNPRIGADFGSQCRRSWAVVRRVAA